MYCKIRLLLRISVSYRRRWKWFRRGGYFLYTCRNLSAWCGLHGPIIHWNYSKYGKWCLYYEESSGPGIFPPSRIWHALLVISSGVAYGTSNLRHVQTRWRRTSETGFGSKNADPPKRDGWRPSQRHAFLFAPNRCPGKANEKYGYKNIKEHRMSGKE